MSWYPHVTVATVVERQGEFLLVREHDADGNVVYNQPAGHLEQNETLVECGVRETLEETGWLVRPVAVLGLKLYRSPHNNVTYLRTNLIAEAVEHDPTRLLDSDILDIHWLNFDAVRERAAEMRSPMVIAAIEDYLAGIRHPLSILDHTSDDIKKI